MCNNDVKRITVILGQVWYLIRFKDKIKLPLIPTFRRFTHVASGHILTDSNISYKAAKSFCEVLTSVAPFTNMV